MPQEQVATSDAVLAGLRAVMPGIEALAEPVLLPRGYGSEVWLVDTGEGPRLVKIAIRWAGGDRLANAAATARLAAAHGIRTPQVLAIGGLWPGFGGCAYSVWEYLAGQDAADALASMDEASVQQFFLALGTAVAALHAIAGAHYTASVVDDEGQPTWADAVQARLRHLSDRYRLAGLDLDGTVAEALEKIAALVEGVSALSRPALVHGDLYLDNLLVGADCEVVVLDFEHARYADAGLDFVKPALFIDPLHPGAQETMLESYQRHATEPALEKRIHLAMGLELVWGIPFFHQWNDRHVLAVYRSALGEWVAGSGSGLT